MSSLQSSTLATSASLRALNIAGQPDGVASEA